MWITAQDYPAEALSGNLEGRVAFILTVSPQGTVTDCRIVVSSGSVLLDETTCRLVSERAHFIPARDANEKPVAGGYSGSIRWALPGNRRPPQPREELLSFVKNADGTISDCHMTIDGEEARDADLLKSVCGRYRTMSAYLDDKGKLVARRVVIGNSVRVSNQ